MSHLLAEINTHFCAITLIFIALDVISGLAKGAATHSLSSIKMRVGFWHKCAFVLMIVTAGIIDHAARYELNLGFSAPIFEGVCVYICSMELVSIFENIGEMNPELGSSGIFSRFQTKSTDEEKRQDNDSAEERE